MAEPNLDKPAEQFASLDQQRWAVTMGMWLFLATELLLFGGIFAACVQARLMHPEAFAVAASRLDLLLGTINTLVLTASTLTMTLAEHRALARQRRATVVYLSASLSLGAVFIAIKAHEWHKELQEGLVPVLPWDFAPLEPLPQGAELFFNYYFALTGLHVLHLSIGLALLGVGLVQLRRPVLSGHTQRYIKVVGLYWSFVDVVWLVIFAMLYLW